MPLNKMIGTVFPKPLHENSRKKHDDSFTVTASMNLATAFDTYSLTELLAKYSIDSKKYII